MRGSDKRSGSLFSYVDLETRVRRDHPLRRMKLFVDAALEALSEDFSVLYSARMGQPSIPPEMLLRAMLLQAFYSIRSERQLMERLEFDLLFRWFVGLGIDDPAWDHSSFTKNRDRLLEGEIAAKLLAAVLAQPQVKRLLSTDHFSVDGTLIEAWASMKSFKPKDQGGDEPPPSDGRNAEVDFKGQKRSNETHRSTTDPEARLYRKGPGMEARLCFIGHTLMENRSGLIADTRLGLRLRRRGLQPGPPAEASRGDAVTRRASAMAEALAGRWRIAEMDVWDNDDLDLAGPAHITFEGDHDGSFAFVAVTGQLDVRYGARDGSACAEFSWDGFDDAEPARGRGWVALGTAGRLVGHIFIHNGDDSGFVAERD